MPGGEEEKALHPHILQRKRKERERKKEGNKERKKELTFSPLPPPSALLDLRTYRRKRNGYRIVSAGHSFFTFPFPLVR